MATVGFDGNPDLYGIGIRIGYYTTALSLWISHLWAPSEAHFLHPITITFLLAMIVGVSVLSRNPSETYAIEPFMLMQISYYTYFMGLGGPLRPDYLPWERDYPKFFLTRFIGLLLLGYDTWYWFTGLYMMRPTPGEQAAAVILYFGRVDIFGWITYVMRIAVVWLLLYTLKDIVEALCQQWWEKRMDHQIPPERLQYLADRWTMVWDQSNSFEALDGQNSLRKKSAPPMLRHLSSTSVRSAPISRWNDQDEDLESVKTKLRSETWSKDSSASKSESGDSTKSGATQRTTMSESDPEVRVTRRMTDQFRKTFKGWQPDHKTVDGQPLYKYTPTLEGVATTVELLESLNKKHARGCFRFRNREDGIVQTPSLIRGLMRHGFRSQILHACRIHIRALTCKRQVAKLHMFRRLVEHPAYNKITPEDILLASRILMTTDPPKKPTGWAFFAILWTSFMTCSILVISTELAIQWSEIRGVQNIGSVGQLIPMAIGVCGLVKTCWTATLDKKHGETWCFGACRGSKKGKAWKAACESFDRARAAWKRTTSADNDHAEDLSQLDKEKDMNV